MRTFFKGLLTVVTIVTGIATIIGLYLQWSDKSPILDIRTINLENLTNKPKITGLEATYKFKDSTVNNLWSGYYTLENKGNETLIGTGTSKNIITDKIQAKPSNRFNILDYELRSSNFPIQIQKDSNGYLSLEFLQWRQDEYFELQVYYEGSTGDTLSPILQINEREILNGKVEYSIFKPSGKEKKIIADYLPGFIHWIVWMLGIISFGIGFIAMPTVLGNEFIQLIKFKVWQKEQGQAYDEFVRQLIAQKKLTNHVKPEKLLESFWKEFSGERPKIPSYLNDMKGLVIATIIIMILSLIPILWMIRV